MKLTTIIPIYNPDNKRKRNLDFLFERLKALDTEILIGLQTNSSDDYFKKFKKVIEIKKEGNFNKSYIFNYCINLVETKFLMLLDSDIYLNFLYLIEDLKDEDDVVKPFNECIYLDEASTQKFISTRHVEIPPDAKRISALGGGATVIKKEILEKHQIKFDESYSGWGYEDFDFGDLLRSKDIKIRTIQQPAAHLYHDPTQLNNENLSYFNTKQKPKSKIVHVFNCFECCETLSKYEKYRNSKILLMNCADIDYLNNDNFRFWQINKKISGFDVRSVIESAFLFLEEDGWILFTKNECNIKEGFYDNIINSKKDFIYFSEIGFAVRKNRWLKEKVPEIYTTNSNWDSIILNIFQSSN